LRDADHHPAAVDVADLECRDLGDPQAGDRYVMLSPPLLAILRAYWRLAKPAHWLFPGRDRDRPVSTATLQAACRVAAREAGLPQHRHPSA
jgi:integrase